MQVSQVEKGLICFCSRYLAKYAYSLKLPTATTDTCDIVATRYGITLANFILWNPSVGPTCAGFVGGTAYCVRGSRFKRHLGYHKSTNTKFLIFSTGGTADPILSTSTASTSVPKPTSKDGSCGGTAGLSCNGTTFGKYELLKKCTESG